MDHAQQQLTATPHPHKRVPGGLYITFEGGEGSGKSTQVSLIYDYLSQLGYSVLRTKQPGGSDVGMAIRRILLHPEFKGKILPKTESLLFWADRYQHHEEIVKPALDAGVIVIGDRDFDSSWALQAYGRDLPHDWMRTIHHTVIGEFKPHTTVLITIPTKVMLQRVQARNAVTNVGKEESRIDDEHVSFHERVRDGFLARAAQEPERFYVVDGTPGVQDVHQRIRSHIEKILREREARA
jgi:dTMP kinase